MLLGLATSPSGSGLPYPSLHRPELVAYWLSKGGASNWRSMDQALLRQIMLRPSPLDHPNFTGSNPSFDPINGPWDVDTDGDGINDSVWVDLGFPVQTAPDGTSYKPLFAIRCLDLDGRLNVNAHGTSSPGRGRAPMAQQANALFRQPRRTPASARYSANFTLRTDGGKDFGGPRLRIWPGRDRPVAALHAARAGCVAVPNAVCRKPCPKHARGAMAELPLAGNGSYNAGVQPSGSTPPYAGLTTGWHRSLLASPLRQASSHRPVADPRLAVCAELLPIAARHLGPRIRSDRYSGDAALSEYVLPSHGRLRHAQQPVCSELVAAGPVRESGYSVIWGAAPIIRSSPAELPRQFRAPTTSMRLRSRVGWRGCLTRRTPRRIHWAPRLLVCETR